MCAEKDPIMCHRMIRLDPEEIELMTRKTYMLILQKHLALRKTGSMPF